MSERIIRASEIGQFDFCAKAWWLGSVEGVEPSNIRELRAGTAAHEWHSRQVTLAGRLQHGAIIVIVIGVVLVVAFLLSNGL